MARGIVLTLLVILAGCADRQARAPEVRVEFRLVDAKPADGLAPMMMQATGDTFYVHQEILLSGVDIDSAFVTESRGGASVEVILVDAGRERWAAVTEQNVGRRIGIIVDGTLVSAPIVRAPITKGRAVITGSFTEAEAKRIAAGITRK